MTDLLREQVSSFMDGELPEEEAALLLKRLANGQELAECWKCYHLIGDSLRGELASEVADDLAPRVKIALSPGVRRKRLRRLSTIAAGVAVLGLAGVVGGLVSHQINSSGTVFSSSSVNSPSRMVGPREVDWRATPGMVQSELSQYLLMHDLYAPRISFGSSQAVTPVTSLGPHHARLNQNTNRP